ncbi:putative AAA+ ATPase domain, ATPase, AAA-type, core, AAA ATPase, AAA+ lid domain-containing protein [Helianthus annuus]|uniref:AAA+ ATPase domain, ATPase, AAA-type, core n=1 Tax=Helianthus annuus TaxID=4232 RepID=A0A251SIJ4_HELAN|nr:probable inactive ATP-dependent zinc metalloprotease FTSHI 3, chloroplastic [Helianthus annuus]KAF5769792.1 putative AAA+ ATPase domain, ATPase, AAA-type, core [Helianthus annuus]KAJ0464748.1 putative AAA+ ATPase domain, ATPase, AAA-type, core, AAA ATPase, AAA+ lid domain-containing protein [Helianthus annuus]KAJ0486346.1 putative AAA+ ATPase domain, ATPase, AAA-type, core, AAA ATPase, AAA+ lid domain-containing protein [Helianthus annuus]KAJ0656898.1 putative AAA+ ATPase domain, ATPase, AAA
MAMANLFKPMINAPKSTTHSHPRSKNHIFSTPSPSSFTLPLPHPHQHSKHAISSPIKVYKGFGDKLNWPDLPAIGSSSFFDEKVQTDEKFQCQWAKEGDVGETEEGTQYAKTKSKSSKKKSGKLMAKMYTVIVGTSFCVVLAFISFALPKKVRLRHTAVPYSDLVESIREGSVIQVQFVENSRVIYYNTKPSVKQGAEIPQSEAGQIGLLKALEPKWKFYTRNVADDKYQLIKMLKDQGITYGSDPELLSDSMKNFAFTMLQLAPYWFMLGVQGFQLYHQMNLGKMTKRKPSKKQSVTFDDVEGVDSAKAELLEIVLCINEDSKYMKLGAKLPRGVLLAGPPGTGKTLLARAVAGEAGVSFFSISASELVEIFVGTGAARVRDIFREARKHAPSIIFIDEIDAVGGQRGRTLNCERDQTLNQLLTEMDGFEKDASVVVIAATNRPETLDSALMRPGRFSRKVLVGEPDEVGRQRIFSLYLRDVPMEEDKEAISSLVASRTTGLVGADLENIAHESVLLAARRDGEFVTSDDIFQAVERATKKIFDDNDTNETKSPNPFGAMAQAPMQYGGGAMGFGFS